MKQLYINVLTNNGNRGILYTYQPTEQHTEVEMLYCDKHEMEKEIYRNMKKRGRIWKSHGKWVIRYSALFCAIKETVYYNDYDTINKIIHNMINKKYIRMSYSGRGNFIILKWVN